MRSASSAVPGASPAALRFDARAALAFVGVDGAAWRALTLKAPHFPREVRRFRVHGVRVWAWGRGEGPAVGCIFDEIVFQGPYRDLVVPVGGGSSLCGCTLAGSAPTLN